MRAKRVSPLPPRKPIPVKAPADTRRSRLDDVVSKDPRRDDDDDDAVIAEPSNDRKLSSPSNEGAADTTAARTERSPCGLVAETRADDRLADSESARRRTNESGDGIEDEPIAPVERTTKDAVPEEAPTRPAIVSAPADVTVFEGNGAVLRVSYQGRPEPTVKWLRVVGL